MNVQLKTRFPFGHHFVSGVLAFGILAVLVPNAEPAYGSFVPPGVCGDGIVDPGEDCDDAGRADCDGCSANCTFEECGAALCTDGTDNDGDGHIDSEDCECATLFGLQRFAVLGTNPNNRSVFFGLGADVRQVSGTSPGATTPYPYGDSQASACGQDVVVKPAAQIEGSLAADGETNFKNPGFDPYPPTEIGGMFVSDNTNQSFSGQESPYVGPGNCAVAMTPCRSDFRCPTTPSQDFCIGNRLLFSDPLNSNVNLLGTAADFLACLGSTAEFPLISGLLATVPDTSDLGDIVLRKRDPATMTVNLANGNNVLRINRLRLSRGKELILNAQPNTGMVLVHVADNVRLGPGARITLAGGLTPDRILWNCEGPGSVYFAKFTEVPGTFLAPARNRARVSYGTELDGAVMAEKVEVRKFSVVNHTPFYHLVPTDLVIHKTDSPATIVAGTGPLTYTLAVHNPGPSCAPGVVITDVLPGNPHLSAGAQFLAATPSQGTCEHSGESHGGTVTCYLGTIPRQAGATVTITVFIDPTTRGTITNTASLGAEVDDLVTGNNSDAETTNINPLADLEIVKVDNVGGGPVTAGTNLTYTLTATNHGPSDANGVVVTDDLDPGVTFVSTSDPANCSYNSFTHRVTCNVPGSLVPVTESLPGSHYTVDINVLVECATRVQVVNSASVSAVEPDPGPAPNTDSLVTTVNTEVDLSTSKDDGVDPATAGTNYTYTVTVHNAGPSDATGVSFTDTLPPGISFVSGPNCTGLGSTVTCTGLQVACGGSAQRTFTVHAAAGIAHGTVVTNNVTGATAIEPDGNPGNEASSATTTIHRVANLSISKTDSPDPVVAGDPLSYTITIGNAGPSSGNATVTDTFPSALLGATWTCAAFGMGASCPNAMGSGDINESPVVVAPGTTVVYTVSGTVDPAQTSNINNMASVSLNEGADPNPANNLVNQGSTVHTRTPTPTDTPTVTHTPTPTNTP